MTITTGELCARSRRLYMPAVADAMYQLGIAEPVLPSYLRPLFPEQRMVGAAFTLEGRAIEPKIDWEPGIERISSYLQIFEELPPDSVMVSVNPDSPVGHFGELTANAARSRGCAGVVLDGNLRDIQGLREIEFQVFYRDLSPLNAIGRWEMIASRHPVTLGDVRVHQGDIVIGEFDGILVVPRADAERVLVAAENIVTAEADVRADMRAGGTPLQALDEHGHI